MAFRVRVGGGGARREGPGDRWGLVVACIWWGMGVCEGKVMGWGKGLVEDERSDRLSLPSTRGTVYLVMSNVVRCSRLRGAGIAVVDWRKVTKTVTSTSNVELCMLNIFACRQSYNRYKK